MKKLLCMWMAVCGLLLIPGNMKGQSLKDILNSSAVKNAVTSVTGGKAVTFENLQGTWMYVNPGGYRGREENEGILRESRYRGRCI